MRNTNPGIIVLLGSGETLPSSGKAHEFAARQLPNPPTIAILETPAGFELNADRVAGKIKEFLETRLTNYNPNIIQIPARSLHRSFRRMRSFWGRVARPMLFASCWIPLLMR